ncbi:ATP-dependent DNA helicase [Trichonephila clavipes]|nr:ATP-dependent DNA helicase [Trichonephila clavipes]
MEIYNRSTNNDGYCHAYITCASTGKAAVAVSGTTVHTSFKNFLSRLLPLHSETAQQCRTLFNYIRVIIIDEINMIRAQILLKEIYVNYHQFVLRLSIYKQPKHIIVRKILWRNLKFYELNEVRRQANQQFTSILTKIGKSEQLDEIEITLIESRFCAVEEAELRCPQDIRLFNTNNSVDEYNNKILNTYADRITSTTKDACIGCASKEQETFVLQKLYKMSLIDTKWIALSNSLCELYLLHDYPKY